MLCRSRRFATLPLGYRDGMTRVLIAVDETEESVKAARVAQALFGAGAEYLAINVSSRPVAWAGGSPYAGVWPYAYPPAIGMVGEYAAPVVPGGSSTTTTSYEQELAGTGESNQEIHAQDQARQVAEAAGVSLADAVGELGDPAVAIIDAAHTHHVDVIVVGSHDRGWFSRLFKGSVSHDVLRSADIPVLIAKGEVVEHQADGYATERPLLEQGDPMRHDERSRMQWSERQGDDRPPMGERDWRQDEREQYREQYREQSPRDQRDQWPGGREDDRWQSGRWQSEQGSRPGQWAGGEPQWDWEGGYGQRSGRGYGSQYGQGGGQYGQGGGQYGQGGGQYGQGSGQYGEMRHGQHAGKGPKGYRMSDERLREDVCQALTDNDQVDAAEIHVNISDCVVTLTGEVSDRTQKREAEACVEHVKGVRDVQNMLRVSSQGAQLGQVQGSAGYSGTSSDRTDAGSRQSGTSETARAR